MKPEGHAAQRLRMQVLRGNGPTGIDPERAGHARTCIGVTCAPMHDCHDRHSLTRLLAMWGQDATGNCLVSLTSIKLADPAVDVDAPCCDALRRARLAACSVSSTNSTRR